MSAGIGFATGGPPLWQPSREALARSNLAAYQSWLARERGLAHDGYEALRSWSVTELEQFWASIWDHFDVRASAPYEQVLASREMPGARWFAGARLNYVENLLAGKRAEQLAVLHATESRPLEELTWGQLRSRVARCAAGLRVLGVEPGDRVAGYLPNVPEALIGFLASASIGAIWSCCSPDFGAASVVDRFAQIEPKVLLCVDGYRYGGHDFDRRGALAELRAGLPSVDHTVVLAHPDRERETAAPPGTLTWDELLASGEGVELSFEQVEFDHPLWILYSSGTTGPPKAIVQGHGGILLEQLKQASLQLDAKESDRVLWFTTTGWMMWNFLLGVLHTGAAVVLYDGSPGHPDLGTLWQLAADAGASYFGTSASFIAACMKAGVEPCEGRDLSGLRSVGSTGSPLAPEGFSWVYDHVGSDLWLFSISGGTDVCSALLGAVPVAPVHRGELQGRALGCAVEAWNEHGETLVGEVGELVITAPMPSMPLFLWGDTDGSRYRESYFAPFPGVWRHGDWIELTERGTAVIHGRSDATINRGGIRMGTAEIYRAVESLDEVLHALVVDVPRPGTQGWMPLFVVLREGVELDRELRLRIARRIRERCSPRHVPNEVFAVTDVPRTLSGKVLEVPVKRVLMGRAPEQVAVRDALSNPTSLDWFAELARRISTETEQRSGQPCR
jgi:acetoacetyl-CoA synthetase